MFLLRLCIPCSLLLALCLSFKSDVFNCPKMCNCKVGPDKVNIKLVCRFSVSNDLNDFYCPNQTISLTVVNMSYHLGAVRNNLFGTCGGVKYLFVDGSPSFITTSGLLEAFPNLNGLSARNCSLAQENLTGEALLPFQWLHDLNLGHNWLRLITRELFNYTRGLQQFNAEFNAISEIESHAFADMPDLNSIVLRKNQLRIVRKDTFSSLKRLLLLDLNDNQLVVLEPGVFDDIPQLQYLLLNGNKLRTLSMDSLKPLVSLKSLELANNRLTYVEPLALCRIKGLRKLWLKNNLFETFNVSLLSCWPSLKVIDINGSMMPSCLSVPFDEHKRLHLLRYPLCPSTTKPSYTTDFKAQPGLVHTTNTEKRPFPADEPVKECIEPTPSNVKHSSTVYIEYYPAWLIIIATAASLGLLVSLTLLTLLWRQLYGLMEMLRKENAHHVDQPLLTIA